ncbi:BlaI/MecI/CopY family transcriptional regulator [Mycolicibacterium phocaicum]|uniref:BlaI/MecI/CopY family transcriptional regulator n=2 Tax=Mycobacteriaceae TaxID=1762 RepID=UPI001F179EA8|nr:BlaI/MecI/CopY family transcriptional regulator [Mycolicibacterium phocaicum]
MDRLWTRAGATSVREVFEELLTDREIAYTTVMSTMDNLHGKGWLTRERSGKAYLYAPAMTREQYSAQLMREALDAGGSTELVLTHFLDHISDDESTQLRKVLQRSRTRKTKP